jgi:2,5-diamino-6-(ribosylamino)-4(3H)-pyrimidinone 5'-phosphate reductase
MEKERTYNTLFLIQSLDGKISTGDTDDLDVDKDFSRVHGVKEGLKQYYDIEATTDNVSFNSGKVQAKVGANARIWEKDRSDIHFVIVDNKPHLNEQGVEYFARRSKVFYLITTNKEHPAFKLKESFGDKLQIFYYENDVDFKEVFEKLKEDGHGRVTIQTGGDLNAVLLRQGLIDELSIVIAPVLVGGKDTQSLIAGESLHTESDLMKTRPLELIESKILENSYLHLRYKVINNFEIDNPETKL